MSLGLFRQSIELDPGYAPSYIGLAEAYLFQGQNTPSVRRAATSAIRRALEIEPGSARTHLRRGDILSVFDWDWAGARSAYERALEIEPELAEAHHHLASLFSLDGAHEAAIASIRRALEIEPISLRVNGDAGCIFLFARRWDDAIAQCRRTLEIEPDHLQAHECLMVSYERLGRVPESLAEAREVLRLLGHEASDAAAENAPERHLRTLDEKRLDLLLEKTDAGPLPPMALALAYGTLGDKEPAFRYLEEARRNRSRRLLFQIRDPRLDPLRPDPRFAVLLRHLGLEA